MKKFFAAILTALVACVSLVCLFGCGSTVEGKYALKIAGGQAGGPMVSILDKDEAGNYKNVEGGIFAPENFWVEIEDDTMTIHGLISPVSGGGILKFNVTDSERKIENFKLETSTVNENWYVIFDSKGEDTLWSVLKNGKEVLFLYGNSGSGELWYSISYEKV